MSELLEQLRRVVGEAGLVDPSDRPDTLVDYRHVYRGSADAIVRPSSTAEVAAVVQACSRSAAEVVTQGGNTGLAGGSIPTKPAPGRPVVVVLLDRLNRIEPIPESGDSATVQAGVTVEALQIAAKEAGRMFAPDWGARGSATVGGAISTNAGGINVLAHGTMRNHVLGLEVVLPDGRVWDGLRSLRKDSSGYDLKQLFIGAEGTLGIITRATLSLLPSYSHQSTAMAAIRSTGDLPDLIALAHSNTNATITALELMPDMGVEAVCAKFGRSRPMATRSDWYLLVRYSGAHPVAEDLARNMSKASEADLITDAVVADTPRQEESLWFLRDEMSPPGLLPHYEKALKFDTAVPVGSVSEYIQRIEAMSSKLCPSATPYMFGHVGDGNLHIYLLSPDRPDDAATFAGVKTELRGKIDQLTWDMGGTISAEHGIGQALKDRITGQKDDIEFELMRSIKLALDPSGIFNPGKTIPDAT